jgi:hypothetical protein
MNKYMYALKLEKKYNTWNFLELFTKMQLNKILKKVTTKFTMNTVKPALVTTSI